jgi:hypothetical protein
MSEEINTLEVLPDPNKGSDPLAHSAPQLRHSLLRDPKNLSALSGMFLLYLAATALMLTLFRLIQSTVQIPQIPSGAGLAQVVALMLPLYGPALIGILVALGAAGLGVVMLSLAGKTTKVVIPPDDRPLLSALLSRSTDGLGDYIRLSSLTGISASFTQMGLSGLPLATILLTIFFALLALLPTEKSAQMFDLSKLTLGAFIGSFVQRSVSDRSAPDSAKGAADKDAGE